MMDLKQTRRRVDWQLACLNTARDRVRQERAGLEVIKQKQTDLREALTLARAVAQRVQEEAHSRIADIVSRSLEAVFDEPYEFKIMFEQKRGRTEARLVFKRGGLEVDPMSASGGGIVDVAAFALRLSCLLLSRPPLRRLLVLDEPFRFVSSEYRGRVRVLVETLAREMGCQFIIVTHQDEFKMGAVVQL